MNVFRRLARNKIYFSTPVGEPAGAGLTRGRFESRGDFRGRLFVSLAASILAHAALGWWAGFCRLPGIYDQVRKTPLFFNVSIVREAAVRPPVESVPVSRVELLQFENLTQEPVFEKMIRQELTAMDSAGPDLSKKDQVQDAVIYSSRDYFPDLPGGEPGHDLLKQQARRQTADQLVDSGRLVGPDDLARPGDPAGRMIDAGFIDRMPGVTPDYIGPVDGDGTGPGAEGLAGFGGDWSDFQPVVRKSGRHASLQEIMVWSLKIYKPDDEPHTYYQLSLRINPKTGSEKLPSIPKEVIFLVDNSLSIDKTRLEGFKTGLQHALRNLNEGDLFNILAFKEDLIFFRPKPVAYDEDTMERALLFVDGLTVGGKTDTYQALARALGGGHSLSPAYIVLFSDGRPTQGVTDSTRLISEISRLNNGKIAIFTHSGGLRVNRYLLDFLSYRNRGWAEHSERTHRIGQQFSRFYDKIRHPVILNLRYQVSGLNKDDLYPKIMPDMFRNTGMVYYGRTEDAETFVLRLLGEVGGKTMEFMIEGNLRDAQEGGPDIAAQWAMNKIYDLISRLEADGNKDALRDELERISTKFKVSVPYLQYLQ
jgi:hypothetical protein